MWIGKSIAAKNAFKQNFRNHFQISRYNLIHLDSPSPINLPRSILGRFIEGDLAKSLASVSEDIQGIVRASPPYRQMSATDESDSDSESLDALKSLLQKKEMHIESLLHQLEEARKVN